MEPRPFSHGYCWEFATMNRNAGTFNGATTFQPWILNHFYLSRCNKPAFNGATTFQPWILVPEGEMPTGRTRPSMEPRPFSHGYAVTLAADPTSDSAFNGATTFQPWIPGPTEWTTPYAFFLQWSHDLSAMDTIRAAFSRSPSSTFNGATTFQPWIRDRGDGFPARPPSFNGATTFQPWIPF